MAIYNIGSLNLDHTYHVASICREGETISVQTLTSSYGGKGLNQSIAAARSGAAVYHAGCIGQGGEALAAFLRENRVDTSLIRMTSAEQGHAIIQVDAAGQNCILVYGGSNQSITEAYVDSVLAHIGPADYLLLQNEVSCLPYIVEQAWKKHIPIILNASPITDELLRLDLSRLTWLVVNEIECMALAGCDTPEAALARLETRYPDLSIVLTLGEEGSVCKVGDVRYRESARSVRVVDTTAAGDTYLGFFAAALCQGKEVQTAMRLATDAAAIAISRPGAADSIPYLHELQK